MRPSGLRKLIMAFTAAPLAWGAAPVFAAQPPVTQPAPVTQPVAQAAPQPAPQVVAQPPAPPATQPLRPAATQPVSEVDLLRLENQGLKEQMRALQRELLSYQSFVTNMGENALRAPFGRLLLVRRQGLAAAILIAEHTRPTEVQLPAGRVRSRTGAKYHFWVQKDGSADFSKPNVVKGTAEVFEESGNQASSLMNLDGIKLQWSIADWIYFPADAPDLEMTITEFVRIEDVRFDDASLIWISRSKLQDFTRSLRRALAEPISSSPSAS